MYNNTRSFWETGKYFLMNNLLYYDKPNKNKPIISLLSTKLII